MKLHRDSSAPALDIARPTNFSLTNEDLEDFTRGAAFLGTGGGGDPYVGRLILSDQMSRGGAVKIVAIDELDDEAFIVCVAVMGAPVVMTEKVPCIASLERSLREIELRAGRKADALIPLEIGGINATVPLALAAKLGLPVVNADGMGRAFPEIQMVTFGVYGCSQSPVVLSDERGQTVVVEAPNHKRGEDLARSVTVLMGGASHVALYPMTGAQVRETAIPQTLNLALDIGRIVGSSRRQNGDTMVALKAHLAALEEPRFCTLLFDGKIVDVSREMRGGFNVGSVNLVGIGEFDGSVRVVFQNENLLATRDGKPLAMVPDLITIVERETLEPITTEGLRYGQRVKVIGISVPPIMRSEAALNVFGPRCFGLDRDYVPLESLA